jgi:hypothetical protein
MYKGCILNPGHGKNSSPGFQFLYTKRGSLSNLIGFENKEEAMLY